LDAGWRWSARGQGSTGFDLAEEDEGAATSGATVRLAFGENWFGFGGLAEEVSDVQSALLGGTGE